MAAIDPGFAPESLLIVHVSVPRAPRATADGQPPLPAPPVATGRELLDGIASVPGVVAVGLGNDVPLDGNAGAGFYSVEGHGPFTAQDRPRAWVHRVSPGYVETIGLRLIEGRVFGATDLGANATNVMVTSAMAERFWPGQEANGKRFKYFGDADFTNVIGIARKAK